MTCATPGCDSPYMPERDLCARCIYDAMATKARAARPGRRSRAMSDGDLGDAMLAADEGSPA